MSSETPWTRNTPQVDGRLAERNAAKKRGARMHSNSGAGTEKNDYSTDDAVYEHKSVAKTHTIKGSDLAQLFSGAAKQGKSAVYVVHYSDANVTLEGVVRRGT